MATFIARQLRCLYSLAWVGVCAGNVWRVCVLAVRLYECVVYKCVVCVCVCALVRPVANRLILSCGYPRLSAAKC